MSDRNTSGGALSLRLGTNSGTVRKTAGTGTTTIAVNFSTTGAVFVESGTLNFTGGFVQIAGNTVLNPTAGRATVLPDWGAKDLELGTLRAAVRQLGPDWQAFERS